MLDHYISMPLWIDCQKAEDYAIAFFNAIAQQIGIFFFFPWTTCLCMPALCFGIFSWQFTYRVVKNEESCCVLKTNAEIINKTEDIIRHYSIGRLRLRSLRSILCMYIFVLLTVRTLWCITTRRHGRVMHNQLTCLQVMSICSFSVTLLCADTRWHALTLTCENQIRHRCAR